MDIPWISIIVGLVALVLLVVMLLVYKRRGEKAEPNYRALFISGIVWLPIGIATKNPGLWVMGLVLLIIGLANKDKWGEEKKWSDLSPAERKTKLILVIGLALVLIAGIAAYFGIQFPPLPALGEGG